MKLIKTTGIVIKEIDFKDNDKIITILTKDLGKISAMVKGAKKTNSPYLASSQYLVYSEFILYQGKTFYHVNSTTVLDTFYDLRIDYDKLNYAFEMTKLLFTVCQENEKCEDVLKLFLNVLHFIKIGEKDPELLLNIFKLRLLNYLGYKPYLSNCANCMQKIEDKYYYSISNRGMLCEKCIQSVDNNSLLELKKGAYMAILYITNVELKKVFSFTVSKEVNKEINNFTKLYLQQIMN